MFQALHGEVDAGKIHVVEGGLLEETAQSRGVLTSFV
jgi:hypothetical protein